MAGAGGIAGPIAEVTSPANGESLTALAFNARRSIDITYRSLDGTPLDPASITDRVAVQAHRHRPRRRPARHEGRPIIVGPPMLIGGLTRGRDDDHATATTSRTRTPRTRSSLFQAGTVNVEFFTRRRRLQDDRQRRPTSPACAPTFTLSPNAPGALAATKPISSARSSLQNPTIGIADIGFSPDGMLVLTIAIGVERATLAFGRRPRRPRRLRRAAQTSTGVTADLIGVLGTFDLGVDAFGLLSGNVKFSLPGKFSFRVASVRGRRPRRASTITGSGPGGQLRPGRRARPDSCSRSRTRRSRSRASASRGIDQPVSGNTRA